MQDFFLNNKEIKPECALYVIATPIGNLADITLRALQILAKVDFILCEDSRVSAKLLAAYQINDKKLIIYNDHGDKKIQEKVLNLLINHKSVALISDAGTPLISDPGYKLIHYIRENNQKVIPLPGASAVVSALCASGIACDNFLFLGFLPTTKIAKEKLLKSLPINFTLIFFESPNRVLETLQIILDNLGSRRVSVARELTKIYEEIITDKIENLINFFTQQENKLRGEFVIIIEKIDKNEKSFTQEDLIKDIIKAHELGSSVKDLSQDLSEVYKIHKKEIYKLALEVLKNS